MANLIHIVLLRIGVGAWNQWRETCPQSNLDLFGANLKEANLSGANLKGVNLRSANLFGANLSSANLAGAFLRGADLSEANLTGANLAGAYLMGADLSRAQLTGANLTQAYLSRADLTGATLKGANLKQADLTGAFLIGTDLTEANLTGAYLSRADLTAAVLNKADLTAAFLVKTQALDTHFNQAILTGACIQDWNINRATQLEGAVCDYIYLRSPRDERCPSSGNFAPGEFTQRFQTVLETALVIFLNGIEWQAFLTAFQKLQLKHEGTQLSIRAIENKPDGSLAIQVNVPSAANKVEIEESLKRDYQLEFKAFHEKYRSQLKADEKQLSSYYRQSANLIEIFQQMANRTIDNKALGVLDSESVLETFHSNISNAKISR
jgi:Pentapeptide repeats (8 copies)